MPMVIIVWSVTPTSLLQETPLCVCPVMSTTVYSAIRLIAVRNACQDFHSLTRMVFSVASFVVIWTVVAVLPPTSALVVLQDLHL